jgi:hypothetical protein
MAWVAGCAGPDGAARVGSAARPASSTHPVAAVVSAARPTSASSATGPAAGAPAPRPRITLERASQVMYVTHPPDGACAEGDVDARVRCLQKLRFEDDAKASALALEMFDAHGDVVGLEREQDMDGGFRGRIHLVPELPVGPYARHLGWVHDAQRDIAAFFAGLGGHTDKPLGYRHRALAWKFFRSVGRTTPSAYAGDWEVAYNVSGSLHSSAEAVTETIFHEVFHLNDEAHRNWSRRVLGPIVDGIVARCGQKTACLAPYAPGKTMVRNGTFYAFQANNGDVAHEYAAELASRYFLEQRTRLAGKAVDAPFECGPEENARAYRALADEFFGGVDLIPPCK